MAHINDGPGTRLGSYEVTALIGSGGMGEVNRAHDTTLDRDSSMIVLGLSCLKGRSQ